MKLLSGILGLTLTSAVALASANAADMYRAPDAVGGYKDTPYATVDWSGFYVGANVGYGSNANDDGNLLDPAGAFGGAQFGYNFQRGNIVFGVEADFEGAGISDSNTFAKSEMNWFGTVRGRLGYSFGQALVYGTGGFAFGNVQNSFCFFGCSSASETQTGYVVGAGVEYKVAPAWSVKAEYQYLDLDASSLSGARPLGFASSDHTQVNTFRVGLNYFVGNGYVPLK